MIRLIAGRELDQRLRTKSFALLTAVLAISILAFGVVARFAAGGDDDSLAVAVAEPVPAGLGDALAAAAAPFERHTSVVPASTADAARRLLEGEGDGPHVDAAVLGEARQLVFDGSVDDTVQAIVQQAWATAQIEQSLRDAGLAPGEVAEVLSPDPLAAVTLDGDDDVGGLAVLTGTMTAILLFVSLQTFGQYVLVGVVEEKSSAVIELLLARVRSDQLLAGKVLGIGVAALVQFTIALAAALVSLAISGADVPSDIWSAVPMTVVWFLGGYALYSTLFGLAGSLVSRQEDAQAASAPILVLMLGAYMVVFVFGYVPESRASTILSLIPPIAPFLMPMRMAAGAASALQVTVAVALLLATIVGTVKLSGRIYEQVLLRRGTRISWRDALASLRAQ